MTEALNGFNGSKINHRRVIPINPERDDRALCAQTDPEAFFPDEGRKGAAAKKVCGRCAIEAVCLQWALDNDINDGTWGGLTAYERRRLKKQANVTT